MAATLTTDGELTTSYFSFPILKTEEDADGNLLVYGKATDGSVDSDEQIVDPDWAAKAVQDWLDTGPNVRVQHNPQRDPAGVGLSMETGPDGETYVKSRVIESEAKRLVKGGALRAYSVGIARPKIIRDAVARGGRIVGGELVEISLVDRPANKNCGIQLVKSAADGRMEFSGKVFGGSLLTKGSSTFSPGDLAKLLEHRRIAEKRQMDPDVGGGTDRDTVPAEDFAGKDRSFPIVTPGDVSDAASSIGRAGDDNYTSDQLKANIIRIAKRKGSAFVAELPESWKDEMSGSEKGMTVDLDLKGSTVMTDESMAQLVEQITAAVLKAKKGKAKKKPFPGAKEPFGAEDADGKDSDGDGKDVDDTDAEAKPDTTKGMKDCKGCGKEYHADSKMKNCENCGDKLPVANKGDDTETATKSGGMCCSGCDKSMGDGDAFCSGCGKKALSADAEKSSKPTVGEGVVGAGAAATEAVPGHREPDGPYFEAFEHDAGLPTVPDGPYETEMKARTRLKSVGAPVSLGALHDVLCPAFHPAMADKCYPNEGLATLDVSYWMGKALDAAASAPLAEAAKSAELWTAATTLKSTDPEVVTDLRYEAHKSFTDANPGPANFPTPTELSAQQFRRPYLRPGHAAPSTSYGAPNTGPVPSGHIAGDQFTRGPLTAGHEADSPGNKGVAPAIMAAPVPPGMGRTHYTNVQRESARTAMQAMHDHIASTFPDICSMTGPGMGGEPPIGQRPVPLPQGMGKGDDTVSAAKSVDTKKAAKRLAKLNKSINAVRAELGLDSIDTEVAKTVEPSEVAKAATAGVPQVDKVAELFAQYDTKLAEITKSLKAQTKRADQLQEEIDALGNLPDPATAPFKGVAQQANKGVGLPEGAKSVAENAERTQRQMAAQVMYDDWRSETDPASRERYWKSYMELSGFGGK